MIPEQSEATRNGLKRWEAISDDQQFAIAVRAVRRQLDAWKRASPELVSVGVGYRLKRTVAQKRNPHSDSASLRAGFRRNRRGELVHDTLGKLDRRVICIRFIVDQKRPSDALKGRAQLPEVIAVRPLIEGKRPSVAIPTDVEEQTKGRVEGAVDGTDGIRVVDLGDTSRRTIGSMCCIVKALDQSSTRYLLSCHHVLTLSSLSSTFRAVARADTRLRVQDQSIGSLYDYADLGDGVRIGCDAAIARVADGVEYKMWSTEPKRIAGPLDRPADIRVFVPRANPESARRFSPLAARFVDVQLDQTLHYSDHFRLRTEAVFRYAAETVKGRQWFCGDGRERDALRHAFLPLFKWLLLRCTGVHPVSAGSFHSLDFALTGVGFKNTSGANQSVFSGE